MKLIIGIDDTDNLESRGTGHLVRKLSKHLLALGIFKTKVISRHQLFVHKDIPYTSHNSSASIIGELSGDIEKFICICEEYLVENSADGSDVGLCIYSDQHEFTNDYMNWGINAKREVLYEKEAYLLATSTQLYLKGLTGRKTGIIGALAAVGLCLSQNDGRVLWMPELRETTGIFTIEEIKNLIGIEVFKTIDGNIIDTDSRILFEEWSRPVVKDKKITLFVEQINNTAYEYKSAPKHFIKSISE